MNKMINVTNRLKEHTKQVDSVGVGSLALVEPANHVLTIVGHLESSGMIEHGKNEREKRGG